MQVREQRHSSCTHMWAWLRQEHFFSVLSACFLLSGPSVTKFTHTHTRTPVPPPMCFHLSKNAAPPSHWHPLKLHAAADFSEFFSFFSAFVKTMVGSNYSSRYVRFLDSCLNRYLPKHHSYGLSSRKTRRRVQKQYRRCSTVSGVAYISTTRWEQS